MKKRSFRALSLVLSVPSGLLASAVFKQVWKLLASEEEAPEATDPERSWQEILLAAALHGAVFRGGQGGRRPRRRPGRSQAGAIHA